MKTRAHLRPTTLEAASLGAGCFTTPSKSVLISSQLRQITYVSILSIILEKEQAGEPIPSLLHVWRLL